MRPNNIMNKYKVIVATVAGIASGSFTACNGNISKTNNQNTQPTKVELMDPEQTDEYWEKLSEEEAVEKFRTAVLEKLANGAGVKPEDITIYSSDPEKTPGGCFTIKGVTVAFIAPGLENLKAKPGDDITCLDVFKSNPEFEGYVFQPTEKNVMRNIQLYNDFTNEKYNEMLDGKGGKKKLAKEGIEEMNKEEWCVVLDPKGDSGRVVTFNKNPIQEQGNER